MKLTSMLRIAMALMCGSVPLALAQEIEVRKLLVLESEASKVKQYKKHVDQFYSRFNAEFDAQMNKNDYRIRQSWFVTIVLFDAGLNGHDDGLPCVEIRINQKEEGQIFKNALPLDHGEVVFDFLLFDGKNHGTAPKEERKELGFEGLVARAVHEVIKAITEDSEPILVAAAASALSEAAVFFYNRKYERRTFWEKRSIA